MKKTRKLFKLFDKASHSISKKGGKVDTTRINQLLSSLYSPGPSFQYIFDFSSREFMYISPDVKQVIGEDHDSFTAEDFMERIHPDDLLHFLHCQEVGSHFLFTHIDKEEIPHYKISYQYRFKNHKGHYELFLHQAIASSWDDEFKMTSSLANHSNINHITSVNNKKVSFIHILGGKSYYGISTVLDIENYTNTVKQVTPRELEILRLISEGFKTTEVAEYLNISKETVATHRRNILKKTDFTTIPQAITHFVKEGLI